MARASFDGSLIVNLQVSKNEKRLIGFRQVSNRHRYLHFSINYSMLNRLSVCARKQLINANSMMTTFKHCWYMRPDCLQTRATTKDLVIQNLYRVWKRFDSYSGYEYIFMFRQNLTDWLWLHLLLRLSTLIQSRNDSIQSILKCNIWHCPIQASPDIIQQTLLKLIRNVSIDIWNRIMSKVGIHDCARIFVTMVQSNIQFDWQVLKTAVK